MLQEIAKHARKVFDSWTHASQACSRAHFNAVKMCPRQESNLNQLVRSEPFYPLNYEGNTIEGNTKAPREGRFCVVNLRGDAERGNESLLIVPNDHLIADENNRDPHLT